MVEHSIQDRLKVAQLGMGWLPEQAGGLNRMYQGLVQHLPESGIDVRGLVCGSRNVATSTDGVVKGFAPADTFLPRRLLAVRSHFGALMKQWNPELVASHFSLYSYPILSKMDGKPHVVHFHGPWASESAVESDSSFGNALKKRIENAVYRRADHFIVLSEAFKNILVTDFGVDESKISLVPGGVDTNHFDPGVSLEEARSTLRLPSDRPILVTVRRLARRMGLSQLIESVDLVRNSLPDLFVVIVGKGPMAPELEEMISIRGLQDHVKLTGFVEERELPLYYRAANLSVMPTQALEGFGLTAVESLAAGTPVAVTPVGGLPEVVDGLSPNLIFENSTPESMADRLKDLLSGDLVMPDSDTCSSFAAEQYSWATVSDKTADVYRQCL